MKRINPLLLLIVLTFAVFMVRKTLFPEFSDNAIISYLESLLLQYGILSMAMLLAVYFFCSFFFIPILIPLNIVCGALYGPALGTLVGMAGILTSCLASTVSVRYVFRGMGNLARHNQEVNKFLSQIARHGVIVAILVRLAFVVPYLLQNIVLALTTISLPRLMAMTLVGALPGVISYSFLGAGLVSLDDAGTFGLYLLVPLTLLCTVSGVIHITGKRLGIGRIED